MPLAVHPLDPARWPDFERLFEARGGPKYCWCMAWRATGAEARRTGPERKAAMAARVRAGVPVGLIGYAEGEPVAWCSVAPRPSFHRLGGAKVAGEDPDAVWSISCFFVRRDRRRQGVTAELIAAAAARARSRGARVLEAYPVDPDSPSYRFMGFVATFERAGFREVARAGSRRHVMRLALDAGADHGQ